MQQHYKTILKECDVKEIDQYCKILGAYFNKNFHQFVQKKVNKGYRVDAIIVALKGLWEHRKDVRKPWPYLKHIVEVEHQNANEREAIQEHEERKKEELRFTGKESINEMAMV